MGGMRSQESNQCKDSDDLKEERNDLSTFNHQYIQWDRKFRANLKTVYFSQHLI